MVDDLSNIGESALVSALIREKKDRIADEEDETLVTVEPEAHYDHYGNRGVADLYIKKRSEVDGRVDFNETVYEVKSEHAVNEANGAGDIIRQFKKMRRYFFQDESREKQGLTSFCLIFIPTPTTLRHIEHNAELYRQVASKRGEYPSSNILFHSPNSVDGGPGCAFTRAYDMVEANLALTRTDLARAAGVSIETIHGVARDAHEGRGE